MRSPLARTSTAFAVGVFLGLVTPACAQRRTGPSPGYRDLAPRISNVYTVDGAGASSQPTPVLADGRTDPVDLLLAVEAMEKAGYRDAVVLAALAKLETASTRVKEASADVGRAAASGADRVRGTIGQALRGEFERQVERTEVLRQSDGTSRLVTRQETVDDGLMEVGMTALLSGAAKARAESKRDTLLNVGMEEARLDAWRGLIGKMETEYRQTSVLGDDVIRFRLKPPGVGRSEGPDFLAVNRGKTPLTNVTLVVELVHFMTAPEPSTVRYYFIPKWEPGQMLHLPIPMTWNLKPKELSAGRPRLADPGLDGPWLAGAGGVVEIRSRVWTSEGRVPERSTRFPRIATAAADWELRAMGRVVAATRHAQEHPPETPRRRPGSPQIKPSRPTPPAEVFKNEFNGWCPRAARRILTFMPADSPAGRRARQALDDPDAFYRDFQAREDALITERTAPGALYRGEWSFAVGTVHESTPANVKKVVYGHAKERGSLGIRIVSRDAGAGKLDVLLFDPARPTRRRSMVGTIEGFPGGRALHLAGVRALAPSRSEMPDAYLDVFDAPGAVALDIESTGLTGRKAGYPYPLLFGFDMTLEPSTDPKLASASNTAAALPQPAPTIDPAGLVVFRQGETYVGDWRVQYHENLFTSLKSIDRGTLTGPASRGPLSVHFEKLDLATKEVVVVFSAPGRGQPVRRSGKLRIDPRAERRIIELPTMVDNSRQAMRRRTAEKVARKAAKGATKADRRLLPGEEMRARSVERDINFWTAQGAIELEAKNGELVGKVKPAQINENHLWLDLRLKPDLTPDRKL